MLKYDIRPKPNCSYLSNHANYWFRDFLYAIDCINTFQKKKHTKGINVDFST